MCVHPVCAEKQVSTSMDTCMRVYPRTLVLRIASIGIGKLVIVLVMLTSIMLSYRPFHA